MKPTYIFPAVMIIMDIGASVMCVIGKDYKKAVYWVAAAVLNACVTFERPPEIDMAIRAINRCMIKRKPKPETRYSGNGCCPNCDEVFMDKSTRFCGNCGQALDWDGGESE